ncbi:MAG TPA: hypothetical protein VGU19_13650 [Microvirga sp.]|jgi:hypothetical protein|nr:hypothetical protein [Microvirga sp.]
MLPRLVLRVKKAVRRWSRPEESSVSGPETEASWHRMMDSVRKPEREAERRLAAVERELNRLGL